MDNRILLDEKFSYIKINIEGEVKAPKEKIFHFISEKEEDKILTEMINTINYLFRVVFDKEISCVFNGNLSHDIVKIPMHDGNHCKYFINIDFTQFKGEK